MDSHPSEELLGAFLDGGLTAEQRMGIARHAAACDDCRDAISFSALSARPARVHSRRLTWAAAAALLLAGAAGIAMRWDSGKLLTPPDLPQTQARESGTGLSGKRTARALLGPHLAVELSPEAAILPVAGEWRLERGASWWLLEKGAVRIDAGGLRLSASGAAAFGVRIAPGVQVSGWFLREASADTASGAAVEIWCGSGTVTVTLEGATPLAIPAGACWRSGDLEPRPFPAADAERAFAWRVRPSTARPALSGAVHPEGAGWVADGPGTLLFPLRPAEGSYRTTLRLRKTAGKPSAGACCQAGGASAVWALPDAAWDGAWHEVAVEASGGDVRLEFDGRTERYVAQASFQPNRLAPASGAGLVIWGGGIEISAARLESLDRTSP